MLEGYFLDLAWLLGSLFFGVMLGSLTGLIPGFHVNNVALILLALSPALLDLGIPLASVAAIIVSTGTVHTFLNYIPSALIGAPDGDTALSLLPGHRMLLSGNAARGVAWSARGSQLGLFLSLPLIVLANWRGFSGGRLPDEFWRPNRFGVAGGVEYGFSSTTTEREQAVHYAKGKARARARGNEESVVNEW